MKDKETEFQKIKFRVISKIPNRQLRQQEKSNRRMLGKNCRNKRKQQKNFKQGIPAAKGYEETGFPLSEKSKGNVKKGAAAMRKAKARHLEVVQLRKKTFNASQKRSYN